MSIIEQTRVSPETVWAAWVQTHVHRTSSSALESGITGYMETKGGKKVPYQIMDVIARKKFSVLWKSPLIRFVFSHEVVKKTFGSEIRYDCQIKGPAAWMVRWLLMPKIRANLSVVLKAFVRQLEAR
jgi:hypothetical protein